MADFFYQESGYAKIPADLENVAAVASELKTYCRYRGIDETVWPQIELGFCEALNNAIEHACNEDGAKIVVAQWSWTEDWLTISIDDPGDYSGDDENTALPDDLLSEFGRGSFLMRSSMDAISHQTCELGHRVIMKKQLHQPRPLIDRLEEMYIQLQQTTAELNSSSARLSVIEDLSMDLAREADMLKIIKIGIGRLGEFGTGIDGEVWIRENGGLRRHGSGSSETSFIRLEERSSILAEAFLQQQPFFFASSNELNDDDPAYRTESAILVLPIEFQEDPKGVLLLHSPVSESQILKNEVSSIAEAFTRFLGIALANASAFSQQERRENSQAQLEVASEIQRSLLPSNFPANEYCKVRGTCVSAMEVGGDYIDAVEIRDVGLFIVIADVMGKGVPAALLATIFRTAIRSRLNLAETPGWLLSKINKQIHDEFGHLSVFITAQAAFYTYDKRKLKLASAGHCPALLLSEGSEEAAELTAEGTPLGIDPDVVYEERLIDMNTGDRVLFLTDGMYEVENAEGQMLGIDGLSNQLPEIWEKGLDSVTERAFSVVEKHIQGLPPTDDKTLMALEIL